MLRNFLIFLSPNGFLSDATLIIVLVFQQGETKHKTYLAIMSSVYNRVFTATSHRIRSFAARAAPSVFAVSGALFLTRDEIQSGSYWMNPDTFLMFKSAAEPAGWGIFSSKTKKTKLSEMTLQERWEYFLLSSINPGDEDEEDDEDDVSTNRSLEREN